jgi:hypothetical protein
VFYPLSTGGVSITEMGVSITEISTPAERVNLKQRAGKTWGNGCLCSQDMIKAALRARQSQTAGCRRFKLPPPSGVNLKQRVGKTWGNGCLCSQDMIKAALRARQSQTAGCRRFKLPPPSGVNLKQRVGKTWGNGVGDFEDENCLPALHLIRSTKLHLATEPPISCRCCYAFVFFTKVHFV